MELGKSILPFIFLSSSVLSRSNILQSVWYCKGGDSLDFFSSWSKRKGKKFPNFDPQTEPQIQVFTPAGECVFQSLETKATILIVSFSFSSNNPRKGINMQKKL